MRTLYSYLSHSTNDEYYEKFCWYIFVFSTATMYFLPVVAFMFCNEIFIFQIQLKKNIKHFVYVYISLKQTVLKNPAESGLKPNLNSLKT